MTTDAQGGLSRRSVITAAAAAAASIPAWMLYTRPANAALESFTVWLQRVDGQPIRNNNPGYPLPQCTELWRDFLERVIGAPYQAGYAPNGFAYSLWTQFGTLGRNDNRSALEWLDKIPAGQPARAGDAMVFTEAFYRPTGHVAVVIEDLGQDGVLTMSQDEFKGRSSRAIFTRDQVHGFLRPNRNAPTPVAPLPPQDLARTLKYRRVSTGVTWVVNAAEGFAWHISGPAYVAYVDQMPGLLDDLTVRELSDDSFRMLAAYVKEGAGKHQADSLVQNSQ